jgi:hypothetical protein
VGDVEIHFHSFVTSVLDREGWSDSRTGCIARAEGYMGHMAGGLSKPVVYMQAALYENLFLS